ncbi:MAG: toxin-antitoxin system YwqK family antitoxin [Bacteroidales bacterium]|nr:toxin-antitoxin system YwqK family antitoxin [Bacteroidales bacterium]HOL98155.1 toxin-antitoxin system YwqK family antitoxin [Bacteroidales bacterium]HOM36513.1 toxin-antitoxin system YwqK family antitoxin [Bacteroidales bacterium]HPD23947.1 toxin-antitoxin system YwqK family antitoxin [Bacteroidales bacterium]HRS99927.1 toxin-antitoxin system YwqK family antitoxin [Bacteroidales bacterium]
MMKKFFCVLIPVLISLMTFSQEIKEDGLVYYEGKLFTGKFKEFYQDGISLKSETTVKNGLIQGKSYVYFPDGNVKEVRSFKNGQKHGKWLKYNEKSMLVSLARYKNNLKHGTWKIWDDNGVLRYLMFYKNGEKKGEWKMYDEKGKLIDTKKY